MSSAYIETYEIGISSRYADTTRDKQWIRQVGITGRAEKEARGQEETRGAYSREERAGE